MDRVRPPQPQDKHLLIRKHIHVIPTAWCSNSHTHHLYPHTDQSSNRTLTGVEGQEMQATLYIPGVVSTCVVCVPTSECSSCLPWTLTTHLRLTKHT